MTAPRLLLVVALALLAGCTGARPAAVTGAPARAKTGEPAAGIEERALLLLLVDRQLYEPFTVDRALSGGAELRRELAASLGRIDDPRAEAVLRGLLLDDDAEVRREAAFALGHHRGDASVAPLLRTAADPDAALGLLAVEALARRGVPLARVEAALGTLSVAERRRRLLPPLFRFEEARTVEVAREALDDPAPELHAAAAYALARRPRPEAAADLRTLLVDADPRVRAWAARGLGEVGGRGDLERLLPLLADEEVGPAVQALRAGARLVRAGTVAAADEWRPALLERLVDPRSEVRATAIEAAGAWLRDVELAAALEERVRSGEPRERELALLALAEGGEPRAADLVVSAAREGGPSLRAVAAEAAARLGLRDLLARLRQDPEARVRVAAWSATLGGEDASSIAVAPALDDPDPVVRAVALGHLAEHPTLGLEALVAAFERASHDPVDDARLASVRALVARAEAEPLERGGVMMALEEVARHPDFLVRRAAGEGLAALGRPVPALGAATERLAVGAYRQIVERTRSPRRAEVVTSRGRFVLELDCPAAPLTCTSFLQLANQGFFDGTELHRVVPDFVVQGGDPRGDGWGGPGYALRDEINRRRFVGGTLGMASAGPHTAGSQWFVTLSEQPHLDAGYTAFGSVVEGADVLHRLWQGDRVERVRELDGSGG